MTAARRVTVRSRVPVPLARLSNRSTELISFRELRDGAEHLALLVDPHPGVPLVRLHSECLTGDVFGSLRCDCGPQLDEALDRLRFEGGVLLYLRQEGRGIGLYNKLDAYLIQDEHIDTFTANELLGRRADERRYDVAADMLEALGIRRIRLLTNNPDKIEQLRHAGIDVVAVEPTGAYVNPHNEEYLGAKRAIAGHQIDTVRSPQRQPPHV
ncbi:GTP cyclohydrolase II [Saccharothrix saharensis]|uniref:GTP cyclohydrolase-2 n=1 Tax=Saccharothrix saharensis TaxID=571190 RepID=A0A543J840_9PSEU|nr:GTP cyclohydrolase II [Saccharothrix saharensis]TQM78999.1 GTP cyclohydrolase II [Saccharothrix saharensis]